MSAAPGAELDGSRHAVAVVGGGQAGLAISRLLAAHGLDHVVLERHRIAHDWLQRRWDSFCLVTPNWQCRLPGFGYTGDDPDGFMPGEQVVRFLRDYAASFAAPVIEGVEVSRLAADRTGRFRLGTSRGELTAEQVVVATGPYQVPVIPRLAERLPARLHQVHSADYRNPAQLPPGAVLVVGSGQSGCQIAEDLRLAGREVHLATGTAPRVARRYRGRDVVAWLQDMGYYGRTIDTFADADAVRFRANHYVTGRDGGHDIDLRAFARDGMHLYGMLVDADRDTLRFADDLRANLDNADAVSAGIKAWIDGFIAERGLDAPPEPPYRPVWEPAGTPTELAPVRAGISAIVWATGFGRDDRWIELPVFDGRGHPTHDRGVTGVPGLYFLGLPWQHTWGSGRFCGVGADAEHLAEQILRHRRTPADVHWISGNPAASRPRAQEWVAPRTVA